MARRITRKQLKEDEFVSVVDTAMHWFVDRWRPIAAGLAAVCAVALLWWLGGQWMGARADNASLALHEAVKLYEGDPAAGVAPDPAGAETAFSEVVDSYGRTDQGDIARHYLARIMMSRGDMDAARQLLIGVADRQRGTALGRMATLTLIDLRVGSGQGAEVAPELEAMVAGQDPRLPRDVALFELASLYADEQRYEEARKYFQTLVDEFPESPYRSLASQRLTELG